MYSARKLKGSYLSQVSPQFVRQKNDQSQDWNKKRKPEISFSHADAFYWEP
jgi:hypothetical protein